MTPSPSRLSHSFGWILIGNSSLAASQWGIVAILAHFGAPEILGAYALGLSIAGVAFSLTNLELRTLQVTDHSEKTPFSLYYQLRFSTGLICLAVLITLAMFLPYSNTIRLAVIAVALSKCLDGLSDVIYSRLQVSEVIAPIAKSQLAKAFLSIAILSLTLAVIPNQLVAIGATVGPYAMVLFFYDLPALRRYDKAAHPMLHMAWATTARQLGTIARLGLPLAVVSTMVVLHAAVPRLVFASQIGETGAGTVAALSYLAGAPNLLVVALAQSSVTRLVRSLATGDRKGYLTGVLRLVSVAIAIGGITLLIGLYFGGPILHLCYGPRFLGHERDLLIFLSAGAVSYLNTAVGYGLSSARVFGIQIPMMAIVCLISLVSSLLFVPRWGLAGAAASQMVSAIVQLLLSAILLARSVVTRFPLTPSSSNGQMMTMIHAKL